MDLQRVVKRMLRSLPTLVCILLLTGVAEADQVEQLVPAFAVDLPGANDSRWRSELRFYNGTTAPQTVVFQELMPFNEVTCALPEPVVLQPGEMRGITTIDCAGPAIVTVHFVADDGITTFSSVTNVAAASVQDPECCYSGFTQLIPVLKRENAYMTAHTLPNIPVPVDREQNERHLARVNFVMINPNPAAITIRVTMFDSNGTAVSNPAEHTVPGQSAIQFNDALPYPAGIPIPNQFEGFYRFETASIDPFYTYVSVVDNATNDATFIGGVAPEVPLTFSGAQ